MFHDCPVIGKLGASVALISWCVSVGLETIKALSDSLIFCMDLNLVNKIDLLRDSLNGVVKIPLIVDTISELL